MAGPVTMKLDVREYNRTFRRYMQLTSRDLATVCNTKGKFIALNALKETPAVGREKIRSELMSPSRVSPNAPLAAVLVNRDRRNKGLPGLQGKDMISAIRKFIAKRVSSRAFMRSGWIPALKILNPKSDDKRMTFRGATQRGAPKGGARPARNGLKTRATLWNAVGEHPKDTESHASALRKYGMPALQRAFDKESASMLQYIERKLTKGARRAGIKAK